MRRFTRILSLATCILLSFMQVARAQSARHAEGVVRDESGNPLAGASVVEKGLANNAVMTDAQGHFSLLLKGTSNQLIISYVGLDPFVAKVSETSLSIVLKQSKASNNDVVVVGYQSQKRRNLTAAVSTISGKDIKDIPEVSFDQALQGRLPGVSVLSSTGELGAKPNIVIRGATNVDYGNANGGNSGPLYVIDGVIYDVNSITSAYSSSNAITGAVATTNPLSLINPNDVESYDVLKDASASAIYGARAGNGVIIIKTKRARLGKPQITVSAYGGAVERPNFRDVLVGQAERSLKLSMLYSQLPYSIIQQGNIPVQLTDSLNPAFNNNIDWQGLMIRNRAMVNSQDVSVAGFSGSTSYRLSVNRYNEQGILNGYGLERLAPHLNLGIHPIKGLGITTDLLISSEKRLHGVGGSAGQLFSSWNFPSSFVQLSQTQIDVYSGNKSYYDDNKIFSFTGSINLIDTIIPHLTINSGYSTTNYIDHYAYFSPASLNGLQNQAYDISSTNPSWTFENYLSWYKTTGEHHFALVGGSSMYSNRNYYDYAYAKGIDVTGINTIQTIPSGPNLYVATTNERKTTVSYYGRLIYDYAGKYLFTASMRRDASSIYSSNYRWATFPSVSAGWIISDENFFDKGKHVVNFLKLRASYGITGMDPGSWYAKYQALYADASYLNATTGTLGSNGGGGSALSGTPSTYNGTTVISPFPYYNYIYNAGVNASNNVRWEKYPQVDIGGDIELFNSRINLTVDWYQKNANDKYFYGIPAQVTSGYQYYSGNYVNLTNKGLEFGVNANVLGSKSPFQWTTNFNISWNKNYVTKLPNGNRDFLFGYPWFQQTLTYGQPLFNYKVYQITGVYGSDAEVPTDPITGKKLTFQGATLQAGDPKYVDNNGDYNIDYDDKVIAGNPMPKVTGGFGNTFSYKGFSLNFFCSFVLGRKIFNGYLSDYLNGSRYISSWGTVSGPAAIAKLLDQFYYNPGDHTKFPRLVYYTGSSQDPWNIASSYFVENGDFMKLKATTLSYSFTGSWLKKAGLRRLNVYLLGENLLTWKASKLVPDPELVDPTTGSANVVYPTAKKFTLGVNLDL